MAARRQAETMSRQPVADVGADGFGMHSPGQLRPGMKIEHPRFGAGTIQNIDTESADPRITVMFSNVDVKTLLLKFAKFKIIAQ